MEKLNKFMVPIVAVVVIITLISAWFFFVGRSGNDRNTGTRELPIDDKDSHTTNKSQSITSTNKLFIKEGGYGSAEIVTDDTYRYISSDGIPEHETGNFPGPGNPNSISTQNHQYRVPIDPVYSNIITESQLNGIALNGVLLESGTAEFYNGDRNSGWIEEAFYNGHGGLGIDWSNAHVQPNGTYHYHALPEGLLETALEEQSGDMIHLAWASDGFPMYYSQSNKYSASYQIKSGTRLDGPGGTYDGKYTADYEYVEGLGDLDECNSIEIDGQYVYLITNSFPFITRCVYGEQDESFIKNITGNATTNTNPSENGVQNGNPAGNPPAGALNACSGKSASSSCSFSDNGNTISGTCKTSPQTSELICMPQK